MTPKILILLPSPQESAHFNPVLPPECEQRITGVGAYRCATATTQWLSQHHPQWILLCGIAGVYAPCDLQLGETVQVVSEREADLGSFSEGVFDPKFARDYACDYALPGEPLRQVRSNSVNAAGAPFVSRQGVEIENMEGAAFFHACLLHDVRFLELRAISNYVGDPLARWQIPEALGCLSDTVSALLPLLLNDKEML
ncbi:MAG: hypothetical protein PHV49_07180 [Alistipes sp.]|nr:hypothetical protein [Alistipes sp.]